MAVSYWIKERVVQNRQERWAEARSHRAHRPLEGACYLMGNRKRSKKGSDMLLILGDSGCHMDNRLKRGKNEVRRPNRRLLQKSKQKSKKLAEGEE